MLFNKVYWNHQTQNHPENGFTIGMMIVLVIVAILSAVAYHHLRSRHAT